MNLSKKSPLYIERDFFIFNCLFEYENQADYLLKELKY